MKTGNISYNYNYRLVANRYYNPRISQFYATDPLAEKYPNFSPYTYTADNPVMLVDPTGMKWKTPKDEKKATRAIKQIKRKIKYYNKHKKKYSDVDERIAELKKSLDDIEKMDKDEDLYSHFENGNKPMTTRKGNTVTIVYSDSGNKIHEIRHGGQIARKELLVDENGKAVSYGYKFEIDAYRSELAFSEKITYITHNFNQVNILSRKLLDTPGNLYLSIPNIKKTIDRFDQINLDFLRDMGEYHSTHINGKYLGGILPLYSF